MNKDRDVCQRRMRPDLAAQFTATHQRHHPVRYDQIWRLAQGVVERLHAVVCTAYRIPFGGEHEAVRIEQLRLIVDKQDRRHFASR